MMSFLNPNEYFSYMITLTIIYSTMLPCIKALLLLFLVHNNHIVSTVYRIITDNLLWLAYEG